MISDVDKNLINNTVNIKIDNIIVQKKYKNYSVSSLSNSFQDPVKQFNIETSCLIKLYNKKHFPILLSANSDKHLLYMNYCGKPINNENIPDNWKEQLNTIVKTLSKHNIVNNDMWINNFLVKDKIIYLIDFGRADHKIAFPFQNIEYKDIDKYNNFIELLDNVVYRVVQKRIDYFNEN